MRATRITIAVIVLFTSPFLSTAGSQQSWGEAINELRLAITPVSPGASPRRGAEFTIALQNVGDKDFVLNLGSMLANGKVMFPDAIQLSLTDERNQTRVLQFSDRRYPGVAGRVDDFVIALRSGSTYLLRTNLDTYWSKATKEFSPLTLPDGRYRIAARLEGQGAQHLNLDTPGIALMNFWKGLAQSNVLEFQVADMTRAHREGVKP